MQVEGREVSHKKALHQQISEHDIIKVVAHQYNISSEEFCGMKKRPGTERKITIYIIKRKTSLTNKQIGKLFGISFSAVSKAAKDITMLIEKEKAVKRVIDGIISSFKA